MDRQLQAKLRVLLLAQKTVYSYELIRRFCELPSVDVVGVLHSKLPLGTKGRCASLKMVWQHGGLGVLLGKLLDFAFSRPPQRDYGCPVIEVDNVNAPATARMIESLRPDLIFSVYFTQILADRIISAPRLGAVNIHPSYLPKYRGVGPTFWVLANNEPDTGVTFHFMTSKVDAGAIVKRTKVAISPDDSVHSLYLKCSRVAAESLGGVLDAFANGRVSAVAQDESEASYYGMPDRAAYRRLRQNRRRFVSARDIVKHVQGRE